MRSTVPVAPQRSELVTLRPARRPNRARSDCPETPYPASVHIEQQRRDCVAALIWVAELMAATRADHTLAGQPRVPRSNVRALMGHLIGTARRGHATAAGRPQAGIPHVGETLHAIRAAEDGLPGRDYE